MNRHNNLWLFSLILLLGTSCLTNKETVIFQNGPYKVNEPTAVLNEVPEYRIQPNDVLSIKVKTLDGATSDYMNVMPDGTMNLNAVATYLNGYSVDKSGKIYLPSVGEIEIDGLTMNEARQMIQTLIQTQLPQATVFVTLVSFKVSVIGEVLRPGYFYVYNNQLSVLEAMAMAGDLDDYADRARIHLIRQTDDGSDVILLDLTTPDVIASPYFYLQPSDVVYVPPLAVKNNRHNLSNLTIASVLLSGITTTIAVISLINNTRYLKDQ